MWSSPVNSAPHRATHKRGTHTWICRKLICIYFRFLLVPKKYIDIYKEKIKRKILRFKYSNSSCLWRVWGVSLSCVASNWSLLVYVSGSEGTWPFLWGSCYCKLKNGWCRLSVKYAYGLCLWYSIIIIANEQKPGEKLGLPCGLYLESGMLIKLRPKLG